MPNTPTDHFDYTVNEWSSPYFYQIIDRLSDINTIYDVGANSGGFSAVILKKFPSVQCYCFEPAQINYQVLIKKLQTSKCFKLGIFYGQTKSMLYKRGENVGALFIEEINAGEPREQTGEVIDLSTLEELELPKPDLIKLDVEGAEENIIEHSTLIKETKWLIVEWHPDHVNPFEFFKKHLPKHEIVINLENKQFLLCLKFQ